MRKLEREEEEEEDCLIKGSKKEVQRRGKNRKGTCSYIACRCSGRPGSCVPLMATSRVARLRR